MKKSRQKTKTISIRNAPQFLVLGALLFGVIAPPIVRADRFDEQINQLKAQNNVSQQKVQALKVEAGSLQEVISALQAQINGIQAQINENTAKSEDLKNKIAEAEIELAKQRKLLGENIKMMYLEGDITTLEILISSKDLSEFVDKQQYRDAVKTKIRNTLEQVTALKLQLKTQREEVERLLKEQQVLKDQVASDKAEQNRLLSLNQGQQAAYNKNIKDNQAKITELRRQQVIENIKLFGGGVQPGIPGGGGYPWGNAYCVHTGKVGGDCYNYDWYFQGRAWDGWGYGFRNCTSWVAYKLATDGRSGFSFLGNAAEWPGRASARGIPVSYGEGARVGDAAVNPRGYYGHVMYVEAVLDDGRVIISDYNRSGDGLYRGPEGGNANVLGQGSLVFIHFPG